MPSSRRKFCTQGTVAGQRSVHRHRQESATDLAIARVPCASMVRTCPVSAIWMRFNSVMLVLVFLALISIIGMLATDVRGGPLDPPGSPSSTDSVRLPGTPISSAPYAINASGHYYLTRDLNVTGAVVAIT